MSGDPYERARTAEAEAEYERSVAEALRAELRERAVFADKLARELIDLTALILASAHALVRGHSMAGILLRPNDELAGDPYDLIAFDDQGNKRKVAEVAL